ncbi:helix-turn-helix domain-containing protein [Paenibacillus apis]|uniref:AraC family transcriptional regulator n=1 Tax=Paenibacillus apis TaxID=1792174 RepID=A0A920CPQ6_9BACL|nr:helix-turn-helix domain-containing protein [Paenibacillus apis]GIO45144.1 AraC family transcriptional regulator [Paenibacillus apis]
MKAYHEKRHYGSDLPISVLQLHDFSFLAHWHNDVELIYVKKGEIRVGINSENWLLKAGDLAVCSSGDIHYYDGRGLESEIILVIFNPRLIGSPSGWPGDVHLVSPVITNAEEPGGSREKLTAQAAILIERMLAEMIEKPKYYDTLLVGLLYELGGLILRFAPTEPIDPQKNRRLGSGRQAMREVLDYLEAQSFRPIPLEEAARQAHMSVYHFSRTFKSTTGMSLTAYLNRIRIDKAEELIRTTELTMLDIALECGFTNVRTFNRAFRQFRGRAPSSLR